MDFKKKILIIEDDESSRETLVSYMEESGFMVISSDDGYKGLEMMKKEKPDLVITDNRLPHIDGIELACINESFKTKIPFILTSAYDDLQDRISKLNVIAFLEKPIDIKILEGYVKEALVF
ncbi:MAG: response regulator [Ignavibacteriae bacterium]|nr:response regulator [Ignavibacteriota bacterium]